VSTNHRPAAGAVIAFGALLAPALICLVASPHANADVVGTGGDIVSYTLGADTLSINTATGGFDSYIATPEFDLDVGAPQSDIQEILFTDPGVVQLGVDDDAGKLGFIFSLNSAEFTPPDPCYAELGGAATSDAAGGLFGL
jgi:hypothetical protein